MAVNVGVLLLASQKIDGQRLDIEDNIGESIHIHYKNMRFDFTVHDFLMLSDGFGKAQYILENHLAKNDFLHDKDIEFGVDATFAIAAKDYGLKFDKINMINLNDLVCTNLINGTTEITNVSNSTIYRALSSQNEELYSNYVDTLSSELNSPNNYSWQQLIELLDSIKNIGYDERCLIATRDPIEGNGKKQIID
ncbi:uncharacterized protein METZ01_LOCUS251089, partial [marine metagenome]